jgi:DNA-binding transcriptional MerR regulator
MDTDNVVVFTEAKVRALAGISQRQLRYWARDLALPAIDRQVTARRGVRLYDFDGVLTVLILAKLKERGFSLQYLRQVVAYLQREQLRLTELTFAVSGSQLHFQRPDGQWQDAHSSQLVADVSLPLEPLRARIRKATERTPDTIGHLERRRGTKGSKELVAGTRVPVATVRRYLDRGVPTAEVLEAFPALAPEDVEAVRASA